MRPRLILTMIVKDEAHCIKRCLESMPPLDGCFIHDTGSSDNTIEVIEDIYKNSNFDGFLTSEKWVNFSHNRNRVLDDAIQKFGEDAYFFSMDADDIVIDKGFNAKRDLTHPTYQIGRGRFGMLNWTELIAKGNYGRWEGAIHETFHPTVDPKKLETLEIQVVHDGARSKDPDRHKKDIQTIQSALENEYRTPELRRLHYQLAQTYEADDNRELALLMYQEFLRKFPNIGLELEWNALLRSAYMMEKTGRNSKSVVAAYQRCINERPKRIEPYYFLARYLAERGMLQAAYEVASIASDIKEPPPQDTFCIMHSIYTNDNDVLLHEIKRLLGK
jgi:glycosyltransferase involved in cell wall biosynthesis